MEKSKRANHSLGIIEMKGKYIEENEEALIKMQELDNYISKAIKNLGKTDVYRIIIGESPYPTPANLVLAKPKSSYAKLSIPEVAFLSNNDTLDMYLVLGILFDSIDIATEVVKYLQTNNITMDLFAEYLFSKFKVLFVNRYNLNGKKRYSNRDSMIKGILAQYTNNIILVIGNKKTKFIGNLVRQSKCLNVIHCSTSAYSQKYSLWCDTYIKRIVGKSTITIKDFAI